MERRKIRQRKASLSDCSSDSVIYDIACLLEANIIDRQGLDNLLAVITNIKDSVVDDTIELTFLKPVKDVNGQVSIEGAFSYNAPHLNSKIEKSFITSDPNDLGTEILKITRELNSMPVDNLKLFLNFFKEAANQ
jgi:hypothetical protein